MRIADIVQQLSNTALVQDVSKLLLSKKEARIHFKNGSGSFLSLLLAGLKGVQFPQVIIANDKESAAYIYNDLEVFLNKEKVLFFPESYRHPYQYDEGTENANIIQRAEVLNLINQKNTGYFIVTYPKALAEKVVGKKHLIEHSMKINLGDSLSIDFLMELLFEYGFERTDFVTKPGEFAIRGGIFDVFSYSHDQPYRIEFFGDDIDSMRIFDVADQLTTEKVEELTILPNIQKQLLGESRMSFVEYLHENTVVWLQDEQLLMDRLSQTYQKAETAFEKIKDSAIKQLPPEELYVNGESFQSVLRNYANLYYNASVVEDIDKTFNLNTFPQPNFNKNFDLLVEDLSRNEQKGYHTVIFSDTKGQADRLQGILSDINCKVDIDFLPAGIHEGFIVDELKLACYTDHQIFDKYHRFKLKEGFKESKQALTIKELTNLQKGDFVVHIDYGIGRFDGLEIMEFGDKTQETIRLRYKDNDVLYVGIHALHKVSRYAGKEGSVPAINKLGTNTWKAKKAKAKGRVKELAFNLIQLYAKRKAQKGFEFSPDNYLQNELEASFMYQDTPDQAKTTEAVKADMQKEYPMDRLVCGDVGFGKTEIAIRAAFKAVCDSKQVAVLVPTTVLAIQHYKTFKKRFEGFPVRVDYVNRFKSAKKTKQTLEDLANGKVDVLIGTHRIVGKDVKFLDLGLLIIDEEQKFGVGVKEKLKNFKLNVDTLTLTATPIPRTLQFSLMGARDLSVINTPPPNRYPIETRVVGFSEEVLRDAIRYEIDRGGQVFFIHNRVQNITEVAGSIKRILPDARVGIGHGQMEGAKLEQVMVDFIEGEYDVLVATTIIESGLDIPNANTIIINSAQNFGLSDLHQMRGRVGRSNKKAFCYLITPPMSSLSEDARKRLRAIEEFSDLGSGFNIAMKDLDIRGAGDLLGAEQSGFITDIGYETYQKILEEALNELKENEFKELFEEENAKKEYVREVHIDSDLELRIPTTYVNTVSERLILYKELNACDNEEQLKDWANHMIDRFGELPETVVDLMETIKLRWIAKSLAVEKIFLKNNTMRCYFINNPESPFFESEIFTEVLAYVQKNPMKVEMREIKGKLALTFKHIDNVYIAIERLSEINIPVEIES